MFLESVLWIGTGIGVAILCCTLYCNEDEEEERNNMEANIGLKTEEISGPIDSIALEEMDEVESESPVENTADQETEVSSQSAGVSEEETESVNGFNDPVIVMELIDPPPSYREAVSYENELEEQAQPGPN
ncbi:unnamed protein product [Oikopleura dioica]|uniref:Uncharacterized protein n=1 Tax=Oikopleura dioica TaxID=34765 RepID=E4Z486_OIKDI|nr:unnamed protein product [Oikopleura dioica]